MCRCLDEADKINTQHNEVLQESAKAVTELFEVVNDSSVNYPPETDTLDFRERDNGN